MCKNPFPFLPSKCASDFADTVCQPECDFDYETREDVENCAMAMLDFIAPLYDMEDDIGWDEYVARLSEDGVTAWLPRLTWFCVTDEFFDSYHDAISHIIGWFDVDYPACFGKSWEKNDPLCAASHNTNLTVLCAYEAFLAFLSEWDWRVEGDIKDEE